MLIAVLVLGKQHTIIIKEKLILAFDFSFLRLNKLHQEWLFTVQVTQIG